MYKVKIRLVGISPLRMNRFTDSGTSGTSRKKSKEEYIQDAYVRSYKDPKIGYYVPREAIKACLVCGGKRVKIGRRAASQEMKAVFHLDDAMVPLGKGIEPEIAEVVVRIPPKTGSRVLQYFCVFQEWQITFTATIVDDRFPIQSLKDACNEAGIYYGLLDGRPDFGRFTVEEFAKV